MRSFCGLNKRVHGSSCLCVMLKVEELNHSWITTTRQHADVSQSWNAKRTLTPVRLSEQAMKTSLNTGELSQSTEMSITVLERNRERELFILAETSSPEYQQQWELYKIEREKLGLTDNTTQSGARKRHVSSLLTRSALHPPAPTHLKSLKLPINLSNILWFKG